jgi:HD-GYP domain-containing protein (c-di-GMP phosphodiesterase class II)
MTTAHKMALKPDLKIDLLDKIWNKVKPEEKEDQIITSLVTMSHNVLGAEAASLLLYDEKSQELYFKFADGPVGQKIKRLHIARQSGIAGWIMKNKKPMVVNNPAKNASFYKRIDDATGFKTRSIIAVPMMVNNKIIGVIEVCNKKDGSNFTQHDLNTMLGVAETAAMAIDSTRMNATLLQSYRGTVRALVTLADAKENCGAGHSRRVAEYALLGATELGLSPNAILNIEYAAVLHDIGKLRIPDAILNKTEKLEDDEWKLIQKHPIIGYNMLRDIPFLREASRLILHHHEKYDGSGYPQGLHAEAIPLGSRLISVADAFDYMTTGHAYRPAMEKKKAFEELMGNMRNQFCPVAVKAFNAGFVKSRIKQTSGCNIPRLPEYEVDGQLVPGIRTTPIRRGENFTPHDGDDSKPRHN